MQINSLYLIVRTSDGKRSFSEAVYAGLAPFEAEVWWTLLFGEFTLVTTTYTTSHHRNLPTSQAEL